MLQRLEKHTSDHLIVTILILEMMKKSNLVKIGKEKIIEELPKISVK